MRCAVARPIPKMYVSPISSFFSRGRSTPAIRAIDYQPCRCLCFGFLEQMMRTTPWRLITLQCSQIGLTLLRTFTCISYGRAKSPARRIRRISELAFENTEPPEASQLGGVPKLAVARIPHLWGSVGAFPRFARSSDSEDRIDPL